MSTNYRIYRTQRPRFSMAQRTNRIAVLVIAVSFAIFGALAVAWASA